MKYNLTAFFGLAGSTRFPSASTLSTCMDPPATSKNKVFSINPLTFERRVFSGFTASEASFLTSSTLFSASFSDS